MTLKRCNGEGDHDIMMLMVNYCRNLNPGRHHVPVLQPGQALLPQRLPHLFVKVQFRFRCFSLKSLHSSIFGSLVSVLSSYYNRSCDIAAFRDELSSSLGKKLNI